MIRLSVTDLDQYLYWLELDDAGPEWLIDRLTIFEPSPAMQAGSAFHGALELLTNSVSLLVHDGYTFNIQCDAEIALPAQRELKIEREILPGIVLVGKIDALDGNRIVDYKLTKSIQIRTEKVELADGTSFIRQGYADSMQWRAYLMLFETNEFEYSIFEGSPDRNSLTCYTIRDWHSLRFYSYPDLESDVKKVAVELAAFIEAHKIKEKMS